MQAILTKFIPATMNRPNRIKAYCPAGSVTLCSDNLPFASHDERAHREVALQLQAKLNWNFPMIGGDKGDGNYCFVLIPHNLSHKLNIDSFELEQAITKYYK